MKRNLTIFILFFTYLFSSHSVAGEYKATSVRQSSVPENEVLAVVDEYETTDFQQAPAPEEEIHLAYETDLTNETSGQYKLGPGDKLKIIIFGHENLSGEFSLDGSGRVSLPLIKKIQAGGLSVAELESLIIARLSPDYLVNPKVSVEILNYRPFYIIGEVKNPGQYPYTSGMTVLTAVALAGGYTYRAKTTKAFITHTQHRDKSKQAGVQSTEISPGDVIEIPEKYWLF